MVPTRVEEVCQPGCWNAVLSLHPFEGFSFLLGGPTSAPICKLRWLAVSTLSVLNHPDKLPKKFPLWLSG